jgi:hypothetical protein
MLSTLTAYNTCATMCKQCGINMLPWLDCLPWTDTPSCYKSLLADIASNEAILTKHHQYLAALRKETFSKAFLLPGHPHFDKSTSNTVEAFHSYMDEHCTKPVLKQLEYLWDKAMERRTERRVQGEDLVSKGGFHPMFTQGA